MEIPTSIRRLRPEVVCEMVRVAGRLSPVETASTTGAEAPEGLIDTPLMAQGTAVAGAMVQDIVTEAAPGSVLPAARVCSPLLPASNANRFHRWVCPAPTVSEPHNVAVAFAAQPTVSKTRSVAAEVTFTVAGPVELPLAPAKVPRG